jgi:hypothetical protein
MIRATLAILFCVFAAMSAPRATGGHHDLIAFGVLEGGASGETLRLGSLDADALRGFDAMVRSPLGARLLQGPEVVAPFAGETPAGRAYVFYGRGTRAPRVVVRVRAAAEGEATAAGAADIVRSGARAATATSAVSAAAARVLLESDDLGSQRDALEVLVRTAPGTASAEAQRLASLSNPTQDPVLGQRRVLGVRTLKTLGGAAAWPALFSRLAADPEAVVAEAAR